MTEQERIEQLEQKVKELEGKVSTIKEDTLSEVKSWCQSELNAAMAPQSR